MPEPDPKGQPANIHSPLVRPAQLQDLTALADILADSFHPRSGIGSFANPLLRLGIYEDLRNRLRSRSSHYLCLVAEIPNPNRGSCLAGTVEMSLRSPWGWSSTASSYPYISNLAVHPEFRRLGVAQRLLQSCERTALEWGIEDLYLHVLENNRQARKLYFKTGYRLQQVEFSILSCLLHRPRKLFLHKHIGKEGRRQKVRE